MPQDDKALLARPHQHGVKFVLIGGVCGVMHGSGLLTVDLDVCCPFNPANILSKEAAAREKDKYALPVLRALAEKQKQIRKS